MQAQCADDGVGGGWLIGNAAYFGPDQSWAALAPKRPGTNVCPLSRIFLLHPLKRHCTRLRHVRDKALAMDRDAMADEIMHCLSARCVRATSAIAILFRDDNICPVGPSCGRTCEDFGCHLSSDGVDFLAACSEWWKRLPQLSGRASIRFKPCVVAVQNVSHNNNNLNRNKQNPLSLAAFSLSNFSISSAWGPLFSRGILRSHISRGMFRSHRDPCRYFTLSRISCPKISHL